MQYLGLSIASSFHRIRSLTLVGEAASELQDPLLGACTNEPLVMCETLADSFSTQRPMASSELSQYRDEAYRICAKIGELPDPMPPPSLFSYGWCYFPHRQEMNELRSSFAARILTPIKHGYSWWETAQYAASVAIAFSCASTIGIRAMKAQSHHECRQCMALKNKRKVLWDSLIDSGLPFAFIGAAGVCLKGRTPAPTSIDDFEQVEINYLMRIMWLHAQVRLSPAHRFRRSHTMTDRHWALN
jgi:hypothetical protein